MRLRVFADVVDRDDIGVGKNAGGLRLPDEALPELGRLGIVVPHAGGSDRLDGDHAADDRVPGEVDDPHGPLAELAQDFVAAELAQPRSRGVSIGHGRWTISSGFPERGTLGHGPSPWGPAILVCAHRGVNQSARSWNRGTPGASGALGADKGSP